jgi:hypothetical protein
MNAGGVATRVALGPCAVAGSHECTNHRTGGCSYAKDSRNQRALRLKFLPQQKSTEARVNLNQGADRMPVPTADSTPETHHFLRQTRSAASPAFLCTKRRGSHRMKDGYPAICTSSSGADEAPPERTAALPSIYIDTSIPSYLTSRQTRCMPMARDQRITWNCRHLANPTIIPKVVRACARAGFRSPEICTPEVIIRRFAYGQPHP